MKPLLRTFLAINAIIVLLFGLLFLVTPFWHFVDVLAPFASAPALIGQLLGVMLVGLSWLLGNAATNGAVTAPVARISGHPIWVSGVVLLIWQIALHEPAVTGQPEWVVLGIGVVLVILGLGQARLGSAVRVREKRAVIGARSAERAEARARQTGGVGVDDPQWSSRTGPMAGSAASRDPTGTPLAAAGPRDEGLPPVPPHSTTWTPHQQETSASSAPSVTRSDAEEPAGVVKSREIPPPM